MQPKKRNVQSTIEISIARPTTRGTSEMFPISSTDRATCVTGLASTGRIYENQRDTSLQRFIAQKLSELIEGPTINPSALVLPNFLVNILSDTRKILKGYLSRDLLSSGHNCFADFMVNLSLISALLSRQQFLELSASSSGASCAFGSFLLENSTHRLIVFLNALDSLAAKLLTLRCHSDVSNSKIHTENLIGLDLHRNLALSLNIDVILRAFLAERRTGGLGTSEPSSLMVSENQLYSLSGSEEGKTDGFVFLSEGKYPGIVVDAGRFKVLDGGVVFKGSLTVGGNAINSSDSKISRQAELRPDVLVNYVVNYHTISKVFGDFLIDPVASISKHLQGILYLGYLLRRWSQPAYCSQNKFIHLEVSECHI